MSEYARMVQVNSVKYLQKYDFLQIFQTLYQNICENLYCKSIKMSMNLNPKPGKGLDFFRDVESFFVRKFPCDSW